MADLYLTPAERYTAALGGFYYGDLPEPGTVYTQLIKDILDGATPDKEPKNILARFIYSLYISDLGDPYPRYELAKLLYWKLHDITPTKSGFILTVTIDGKEDYMTINTDLSRLWYKVLFGSKTDVITEFPYIFNTMQNKLSDWELFGNTSISGTPTPDNPIMPQGTGDLETVGAKAGQYKIPISSASTTTPVYLGEVQTVRQIYKMVLDGTEGFSQSGGGFYLATVNPDYMRAQGSNLALCTHYVTSEQTTSMSGVPDKSVSFSYGTVSQRLYLKDSDFKNTIQLKTYLAQQYAAGTPVTVWYVLATPETAVVNEPLMKIGEYADSLSRAKTGIDIPTVVGQNTLNVLTTVKPSSMRIEYTSADETRSRSKRISLLKKPLVKSIKQ
jgi:hypothetical protein